MLETNFGIATDAVILQIKPGHHEKSHHSTTSLPAPWKQEVQILCVKRVMYQCCYHLFPLYYKIFFLTKEVKNQLSVSSKKRIVTSISSLELYSRCGVNAGNRETTQVTEQWDGWNFQQYNEFSLTIWVFCLETVLRKQINGITCPAPQRKGNIVGKEK